MAENLEVRATTQLNLLRAWSDRIGTELGVARAELSARHPDPSTLDPDEWAAALGATQHVATARAELSALRVEQDRIRAQLATVANPADTETFEGQLRDVLVADARIRVQLRLGDERVAAGEARIALLTGLVGTAATAVAAGEGEVKRAAGRQAEGSALRAALASPPLDRVVVGATVASGSPTTLARARLAALLPEPLLERALARATEADTVRRSALAHDRAGATRVAAVGAADALLSQADAEVAVAERAFVAAAEALAGYVHTAGADLTAATTALPTVTALPDLSAAQQAALHPAPATAEAALQVEADLATAVEGRDTAQRVVDDAVLDAVLADPDADPFAEQAVRDAVAARDADAVQGPLSATRAAYDAAARDALDAWEVEVPPTLWQGTLDFAAASRTLAVLADQAERDALVGTLDAAQDTLAAALDVRDGQVRAALAVALTVTARAGAAAAATATATDRTHHYLRGDGPGGRTPAQL